MRLVLLAALSLGGALAQPVPIPTGLHLIWHDEFSGPYGAGVDAARWTFDEGGDGWGNSELEFYTTGGHNAWQDGAGHLVIAARPEASGSGLTCWYGACRYSSARLSTKGKFQFRYGRVEARLNVPAGAGLWPAFWMLGAGFPAVPWPNGGEIDIMENLGREPGTVHGTLHGPGYSGADGPSRPTTLPGGGALADEFHVFAVDWSEKRVQWLLDGTPYFEVTPAQLPQGSDWVFDQPFFLLLNLAVGGAWPGEPDAKARFPARLLVDWVRVYQR